MTSFFRDPAVFDTLKREVLPGLLDQRPENEAFRVWVAGCATGEEAYSLAMLLRELADEHRHDWPAVIYGTDIDADAISVARTGLFPPNIAQDVTPERLRRFFVKEKGGYRVRKEIRDMVVFAVQSVIKDPPFTRLDLLTCRNLPQPADLPGARAAGAAGADFSLRAAPRRRAVPLAFREHRQPRRHV